MKPLTVGQGARLAGVGVETVRFYEKNGVLEEPTRRASGYREYDGEAVNRLRFIQRAKELGFSLAEIKELLSLRCSERPCDEVRQRAEAKVVDIEAKVAMLLRMKEVLGRLASSCCEQRDKSRCPIRDALDDHEIKGMRNDGDENDGRHLPRQRDEGQGGRPGDAERPRKRRVPRPDRSRR